MNHRKLLLVFIDAIIVAAVCIVAGVLLPAVSSVAVEGNITVITVLFFAAITIGMRCLFRIFSCVWRYANVNSYLRLVMSDTVSYLIIYGLGRIHTNTGINTGFAYVTICMLTILLVTLISRFVYEASYIYLRREKSGADAKTKIAIIGAGTTGSALAQELTRASKTIYKPVCFVDKDNSKVGQSINGIPVLAETDGILNVLNEMQVKEIVLAIPDAKPENKLRLHGMYKQLGLPIKIYDYPLEGASAGTGKKSIREFEIEDLLFREKIIVNNELAKQYYSGKTVLVTGGGGSIGSELCRQIAKQGPKKLIILDNYENNAYDIQQELIRVYQGELNLDVVIATVRDEKRLEEVFRTYRPEIVFHAAAHKHVPLMENNACEAIKNNVFGTYNVANMAEKYGAEKFLLISTDKAVNPTNVMGASKRLCEMVIQCRSDSNTKYTAVRFGNVLGSNGSVIPLFKRQIAAGGPVTLTDKRIIRYFMTISEAVGLVMETAAMANNGELFVLNMGKPVKILELAEKMVTLSGYKPYEDIDIVEVGLRPGEKLYEELLMKTEELTKTENDMIFIERDTACSRAEVEQKLAILREAVDAEGNESIKTAMKATVPTYCDPDEVNSSATKSEEMLDAG